MTPAERVAKNLPKNTGGYALRPETFKAKTTKSKSTKASAAENLSNPMGDAYAKGGMTKKKKAC